MEINVTNIVQYNGYLGPLTGSVFELGENAARLTWGNSLEYAKRNEHALKTEEQLQAARDHFRSYGAWSEEEVNVWSPDELNALIAQEVQSSMRDIESEFSDMEELWDAPEYVDLDIWGQGEQTYRLYPSGKEWLYYLGI